MSPGLIGLTKKIRDGLFIAASRTYGEQYLEPFIRAKYRLSPSIGHHDAIDLHTGQRYEIKAAKVLIKHTSDKNLIKRIVGEIDMTALKRMICYADRYTADYRANIQNVKRDHFDYLIYVLLFCDRVVVFQVPTASINKESVKSWSDKHGLYDQFGKSGQFNINKLSIGHHESNYQRDIFTYEQLKNCYKTL